MDNKKNLGGRPRLPDSERMENIGVRLNAPQRAELERRGGVEWLRAFLDGADASNN